MAGGVPAPVRWVDSHCHLQLAGGDEHVERARAAGVEALCYYCRVNPVGIEIEAPLAIAARAWKA